MTSQGNPHISGLYIIVAAIIGVCGTVGAVFVQKYFDNDKISQSIDQEHMDEKEKGVSPITETLIDKDDLEEVEIDLTPLEEGSIIDHRDGQEYRWARLRDGKKWMTENLNYNSRGSRCYNDDVSYCQKYGRLYTWYAAKFACPNGWKIPSEKEWYRMLSAYGKWRGETMSHNDRSDEVMYTSLVNGGQSRFNAVCGGTYRTISGYYYEGRGYYWTSSKVDEYDAWVYHFHCHNKHVNKAKQEITKHQKRSISCRCIEN